MAARDWADGGGVVHQVLGPGHELLAVGSRGEDTAALSVREELEQGVGGLGRRLHPSGFARELSEADERIDQRRVVLGVGQVLRPGWAVLVARLPAAQPPTVGSPKVCEEEFAVGECRGSPVGVTGCRGGLGQ